MSASTNCQDCIDCYPTQSLVAIYNWLFKFPYQIIINYVSCLSVFNIEIAIRLYCYTRALLFFFGGYSRRAIGILWIGNMLYCHHSNFYKKFQTYLYIFKGTTSLLHLDPQLDFITKLLALALTLLLRWLPSFLCFQIMKRDSILITLLVKWLLAEGRILHQLLE